MARPALREDRLQPLVRGGLAGDANGLAVAEAAQSAGVLGLALDQDLDHLSGYVKNLSDGSVYIEVEGYIDQLDYFVNWCRTGPGDVEEVRVETNPPAGYSDFRIGY